MQTKPHSAKSLLKRVTQDVPLTPAELKDYGLATSEHINNFWYVHHLFSFCKSPVLDAAPLHAYCPEPINREAKRQKPSKPTLVTPSQSMTDLKEVKPTVDRYNCTVPGCSRSYQTISGLKYHRKTGHTGLQKIKPAYECSTCGQAFPSKRQKSSHEKAGVHLTKKVVKEPIDVIEYYLVD